MKLNISLFLPLLTFLCCGLYTSQVIAKTAVQLPSWQLHQVSEKPSLRCIAMIGDSLRVTGSNNSVFVSQDGPKTWLNKSVKHSVFTGFRDI